MKEKYYSSERSVLLLVSLLKQHGIKKCILSPGTTNLTFVASLQCDSWFELYSSVDERSAAYMACGLAAESGEPVVLSCTGATASRNYLPGLTEAYYRKLPVLAVTATQYEGKIGQHVAQVIDRRVVPNDAVLLSEYIPVTRDNADEWSNTVKLNRALLELSHRGGGPVHLNFETTYSRDYSVKELPLARMIGRTLQNERFPLLPSGRIAVFIGSHSPFTAAETSALDAFCAVHNAVVFCDHTSGYKGQYGAPVAILAHQDKDTCPLLTMDLLVHIGEVSGAYITLNPKAVWRVNPDGELRDTFQHLTHVFEMEEQIFFSHYTQQSGSERHGYLDECKAALVATREKVKLDDLPFSNVWMAGQTASRLPEGSSLFLGILNSLRAWNLFEIPSNVQCISNTGGFGIDGGLSSCVGASLAHSDKLYFCVLGDLAFFYDMNVLGNRHVGRNIRILLVNNGKGTEFCNYNHPGAAFGNEVEAYIAAAGHYGNKSPKLVHHYAEDLGYEYLFASNKEEYMTGLERFLTPTLTDRPMLFEVFTNSKDESEAIRIMRNLNISAVGVLKGVVRTLFNDKKIATIKTILNK